MSVAFAGTQIGGDDADTVEAGAGNGIVFADVADIVDVGKGFIRENAGRMHCSQFSCPLRGSFHDHPEPDCAAHRRCRSFRHDHDTDTWPEGDA